MPASVSIKNVPIEVADRLRARAARNLWLARALEMPLVTLDKTLAAHAKNI